ncbi:hypothetical protein B0H13DRAFT_1935050 [Mycena leptocephala]|nr:hypothetical protein B0H13DRAFT_1935050 [Mycena leptocephala]
MMWMHLDCVLVLASMSAILFLQTSVPCDIVGEIATYCRQHERCQLSLVSRSSASVVLPTLYRKVKISQAGRDIIRRFSTKENLSRLVRKLHILDEGTDYLDGPDWERAMVQLINLKCLIVGKNVSMTASIVAGVKFKLSMFHYLVELVLYGTFPDKTYHLKLPALRRLKAYPDVALQLLRYNAIEHIWIYRGTMLSEWIGNSSHSDVVNVSQLPATLCSFRGRFIDFLRLMNASSTVQHITHVTFDEDDTWRANKMPILMKMAARYTHCMPCLSHIRLVAALGQDAERSGFLTKNDGAKIQLCWNAVCFHPPTVDTFHFCGADGCMEWTDWTTEVELMTGC